MIRLSYLKVPKNLVVILFLANFFIRVPAVFSQEKFKVCIDAGHGGTDPGNLGGGYHEKDIALKIALEVGKILESKGLDVVYTRDDDTFIGLQERGEKAHKTEADIFVSIHCDAFEKNLNTNGVGTFVLALRGNGGNLRVAQNENAVIAYEDNYQTKYKNFDPNSPESIIGNTVLQEEFLDESLLLASLIQKHMVNGAKRRDRLVKQDNFQVLRETFMPSVLVETGFLTNKAEGAFLNSKEGQKKMAAAISEGIIDYKEYLDANTVAEVKPPQAEKKPADDTTKPRVIDGVDFKIQIASSTRKLKTEPYNFNGLKGVERMKIGSQYKYLYGKTNDYNKAKTLQEEVKEKGYGSAFIVAFKNEQKISVAEALKGE
ncbi:MAG: N-acetylmuramoyl-L-alanine amidase [Flavobacteriaceae bacterium]|nr:N-acetylmuramoyl-L-alanine amidase [Flavobacteriaceae bacterium]